MLVGQDGVPGAAFGHICAAASLQQSTCLPIRQESMRTANGDTVLDLHERAESVPFDLKKPIGMTERSGSATEWHGWEIREGHRKQYIRTHHAASCLIIGCVTS